MATLSTYCEGDMEVEFQNEEEQSAFDYLLNYYEGDFDAAYEKFYSMYRQQDRQKYLRNTTVTKVVEGFTLEQQRSNVQMMKKMFFNLLDNDAVKRNGQPKVGIIRDAVRNYFDNTLRDRFENDPYRQAKVNDIVENFDDFWEMTQKELEQMGVEITNDGSVARTEGIDAERKNWDDYARFTINPKDTASTRVKLALSFIPSKRFKRSDGEIVRDEDNLPVIENDTNYLGANEFAPMDNIYDKIGETLSDFIPSSKTNDTYEAMIDHLRNLSQANPQMLAAVNRLEQLGNSESFKADFVNTFGKTYEQQAMILLSPIYGRDGLKGYNLNVIDSNRTSQVQAVKEKWAQDQKTLPLVSEDQEGDLRIDRGEVQNIRENYISQMREHLDDGGSIQDTEGLEIIKNTLSSIGLTTRFETLEYLSQNPTELGTDGNWNSHVHPDTIDPDIKGSTQKGLMYYVFNTLEKDINDNNDEALDEYGKLGLNNPLSGRNSQGIVNRLAKAESEHAPKIYAPSFRNIEGNQIHALQDHTSLTREFARLKENPGGATSDRGVYDSESVILQSIENDNANIRDLIDIEYTDGLKRTNRKEGSPYENMSTSEKELTRLALFQNPQENDRVKFLAPTLSDKSREYVLTLPRVQKLFGKDRWLPVNESTSINDDGSFSYRRGGQTIDGIDPRGLEGKVLYNLAKSEMKRIQSIQKQMENGLNPEDHPLGEDYMWEGQFFYFFPELNPSALGDQRTKLWAEVTVNGKTINKLKNTRDAKIFMRRKLVESLEQKVQNTKDRWREQGITIGDNTSEWMMDRSYLKNTPYGLRDNARKLTYAALDYNLSQRFFNSEITKILAGDPALHVKRSDPRKEIVEQAGDELRYEDAQTINESIINLQKRLANHIAPALTQNVGSQYNNDNLENTSEVDIITLQDRYVDSKHIDQYEEIFDDQLDNPQLADAYRGIESTDAQEYTTLEEHIRTQLLNGEISKELHDKIKDRIEEVKADENNTRNYFKLSALLTEEEMNQVFMPHKDVYVGRNYINDSQTGINTTNWIYRKTSSIPLIPEVTDGTDLDNLRVAMENKDVDRAAYQSADKTGAYNPFSPFDENADRKEFQSASDIENKIITQNDVNDSSNPYQEKDKTVQTVNRRDLGLQFQIPVKDEMSITRSTQMDKLITQGIKGVDGFDIPWIEGESNGRMVEEEKQRIISEIWNRGKDNLLDELNAELTDHGNGKRSIRFENIDQLQQILEREAEARDWSPSAIDSIQIEGDSFVLPLSFSPASTKIESLLLSVIENRTTGQEIPGKSYVQVSHAGWHGISNRGSVATTSNFDPETGLKHLRIEDGEVKPAQVLVTWNFKDENGDPLPMENYVDEDGNIDDSKLDPELREMIGFRLPNQAGSSMLPIEVVGFLPPNQAKTMVVTEEIVAQMGSDFDVDKVNTYQSEYAVEEDGNLRQKNIDDEGFTEIDKLKSQYKDIHWTALTNPEAIGRVLKPLDMEYLSNEADVIQELKNPGEEVTDFLSPHYQVDSHNAQHAGKTLIGNFSLASNFNSMLEMHPMTIDNAEIRVQTDEGPVTLNQVGGDTMEVRVDEEGTTVEIPDVLMMLQNAALDNAKELILDKINATPNTAETIATLAMLNDGEQGISLPQLSRFFAQESITMLNEELSKVRSQTNDSFVADPTDAAIRRVYNRILSNFPDQQDAIESKLAEMFTDEDNDQKLIIDIPQERQLTTDLIEGNMQNDPQYAFRQLQYLANYSNLNELQQDLTNIRSVVNFGDRKGKGPGKTLLHSLNKLQDYNDLEDKIYFRNAGDIVDGTEWEAAIDNSFKLAWEMLGRTEGRDLFHYNSSIFQDVKYEIERNSGKQMSADDAQKVFREMKSFVFSSTEIFDNPEVERSRLLEGTENVEDIATRVKEAQDGWGRENFFINRLRPQIPESNNDIATVLFSADKGERTDDVRLIQEFATLLASEDPKKRLLAEDLVKYSYLVSGGVQTPTSFSQYIPVSYIVEELGINEAVDAFDFHSGFNTAGKDATTADRFMEQYFQHNPTQAHVVSRENSSNMRSRGKLQPKYKTMNHDALFRLDSQGNREPIPFASIYDTKTDKWRLWMYGGDGNHYEIDTLGKANEGGYNTVEYNVSRDKRVWSSNIKSNQTRLKYNPWGDDNGENIGSEGRFDDSTSTVKQMIEDGESEIDGETFYDSVEENETDPYVSKLADFMRDIDTDFRVRFAPQSFFDHNNIDGYYHPDNNDVIWISRKMTEVGKSDTYINRTVLHELIHKQTTEVLNKSNLTDTERKLVNRIENIFESTVDQSDAPPQLKNAMTDEDGNYDIHEFLAYGIANERGAEWLKNVTLEGDNKNVFERLLDGIKGILQSIANSLGVEIESNSALAYTIDNTLRLFEETQKVKDRTPSDPNSKSKSDIKSDEEFDTDEQIEEGADNFADNLKEFMSDNEGRNQKDLGQSVGEFRRQLSDRQKKVFDQIRTRINTRCD